MFKFSFSEENVNNTTAEATEHEEIHCRTCEEIQPDPEHFKTFLNISYATLRYANVIEIKHILPDVIIDKLKEKSQDSSILQTDRNHSDLETGVYEGGLKIWECTHDLASYISKNNLDLMNKNILDLGCGAGIIGILALLNDSYCDFQDYNDEVISYITIPNVILNAQDKLSKCRFYSGDWLSFLSKIANKKYDVIFTCETIYNARNYQKLNTLFKSLLGKDGIIYLAAKTYYFGVGGGLREFESMIKQEGVFDCFTCWKCLEGVQREILMLKYKNCK